MLQSITDITTDTSFQVTIVVALDWAVFYAPANTV